MQTNLSRLTPGVDGAHVVWKPLIPLVLKAALDALNEILNSGRVAVELWPFIK
jgi:hypothetical protein